MIAIKDLKKCLISRGSANAFELDIPCFSISAEEVIFCVGPNGAGKSTFLALLQGLMLPDSGTIHYREKGSTTPFDLLALAPHQRARYLGIVPQEPGGILVEEMSILDHVLARLVMSNNISWFFPKRSCRSRSEKLLATLNLGLEGRVDEPVGNLSSGERQAIAVLLATMGSPGILLFDEFTASLDPEMSVVLSKRAFEFIRKAKLSAIFVTHRYREAIEFADRIIVLNKGMIHQTLERGSQEFSEVNLHNVLTQLYLTK